MRRIKGYLASERLWVRIVSTYLLFILLFFGITVLSYFLLPEGFLRDRQPLLGWDTAPSVTTMAMQIFFFNMISVLIILFGNLFATRRKQTEPFMPVGFNVFFILIMINAVVLGTWSFSVVTEAPPLSVRILGLFDLFHRAALWEMSGQLLILCGTAKFSLVMIEGKQVTVRKWWKDKLPIWEWLTVGIGLLFMLAGALIESISIAKMG